MTEVAYGGWPSPLPASLLASGSAKIAQVATHGRDVYWAETRSAENGRSVIVRGSVDHPEANVVITPVEYSVRSGVHVYGGGAWWLGPDHVYFVNADDQRIYRQELVASPELPPAPEPVTPEPPSPKSWRYADGNVDPSGRWLVCIQEVDPDDAESARPGDVVNRLVAIDLTRLANDVPSAIAPVAYSVGVASDFVAKPRFSPDGRWLSWLQWSHPNMPWDGTELWVAPVEDGVIGSAELVAGGEDEAICSPGWTADGELVYSSDTTGWWNLYAWHPTETTGSARAITAFTDAEVGEAMWSLDSQRWTQLPTGELAVAVTQKAADSLMLVDPRSASPATVVKPIDTGLAAISGLASLESTDREPLVVLVGAGRRDDTFVASYRRDGAIGHHYTRPFQLDDSRWIPTAVPIEFSRPPESSAAHVPGHAFVYWPQSPDVTGPSGAKPPLIVVGHGGPTAHSSPALNLKIHYWTTRGFAVADVNYGGSTGFGREYRRLLRYQWGVLDVEDCISVAAHLIDAGTVDPTKVAIRGSSAGGLTVLAALAQSEVFAAGMSLYGVTDLEALALDTHKFESRYLDRLVGEYPADRAVYQERSPINQIGQIRSPMLVMQGLQDHVVPPNQAEHVVAALAANKVPYVYETFAEEGHGFRLAESIIRSLELELWFYGQLFGFTPHDPIDPPVTMSGAVFEQNGAP